MSLKSFFHDLIQPSPVHALELLGVVLVAAAVVFFFLRLSVTTTFTIGIGLEIFSGNWKYMHVPLPLDRVVFLAGVAILIFRGVRRVSPQRRIVFSPIHLLFAAIVLYATLSAWSAGTLTTSVGFYALLDRLGVIPFVMFTLAPLLFGSSKGRNTLLIMLVAVGFYLGMTACLEGVGANHLVLPTYINNPAVGIHYGRARGPFVEAAANGLSMFMCGSAALVALTVWRSRLVRLFCLGTAMLCAAGALFTLTREVWLGALLGALAVVAYDRRLRRRLPLILTGGVVGGVALLVAVPGLWAKVSSRGSESSPIWARYNTDRAAILAWQHHPLFGIGWETFITKSPQYLIQAATYPLNGTDIEVHNVFLSRLAELGGIGFILWTAALLIAVGGAALRRGPSELYPWRLALIGIFICFFIVANSGPTAAPFPNLVLWLWAGVVASHRFSAPRGEPMVKPSPSAAMRRSVLSPDDFYTSKAESATRRVKSGISSFSSAKVP